ncbi:MAG: DUF4337 family protein [Acetobacteraceae bacterium]|nr:DUF4337 family protein [Acetobacteraceae bacterium]
MSESIERAHETIHEAHHAHAEGDRWARVVAVLVSVLAASLALAELGSKSTQNAYLTQHIALSNDWAFYQAKNERAVTREAEATLLEVLPNAADPAIQAKIAAARDYAARMRDDPKGGEGMKQLADSAHRLEGERDAAFHRYHGYEYSVGALEIAIVLASVSLVARSRALTIGAGVVGALAALFGLAVAGHLV